MDAYCDGEREHRTFLVEMRKANVQCAWNVLPCRVLDYPRRALFPPSRRRSHRYAS